MARERGCAMLHRDEQTERISIWEDLKRRNVYRVGVGYAAVAWLAIEVSETVFPRVGLPDWSVTLVIVLAMIGIPIALLLSWTIEITPGGLVFDKPIPVRWPAHLVIDLFIVLVLAVAGSIYWYRIHDLEPPGSTRFDHSIAVLPFVNIGDDPANEAFSFGLADELLTALAQLEELDVSSRTAAEYFADRTLPMVEIAEGLGVRYLVEGSVQHEANRVRITVQLIDTEHNRHIWATNYEKALTGLLSLRSQLAADVVGELGIALSIPSAKAINAAPTDNGEAYVAYLRGKEYLRRPRVEENLSSAEGLFQAAIEADPRFASAYAGLCRTYLASFAMQRDSVWFEKAERACHRTMTLDETLVDVHIALGDLYRMSSQHDKALDYFDAALQLDPGSVEARMTRGITLESMGRTADAETTLREAVRTEEHYWRARRTLGRFLMRNARYEEAVEQFRNITELTPNSSSAFNNLAAALYMAGDIDAAIATFDHSIDIRPSRSALANIANLHYYQGEFEKAAMRYRQAAEMAPKDDRPLGGLAASLRFVPDRAKEASETFRRAAVLAEDLLALTPTDSLAWARLASYRAYTGAKAAALTALERSRYRQAADPEVLFYACLTYMEFSEHEEAIRLMGALVELGYTKDILRNDPDLAPIRRDSRVVAMLSSPD